MITLQERVHGVKPPKDWPLSKLHHVFTVRKNNKNIGMLNDNLLSLSYGRIINKDIDTTEGLLPESFETYQIVYPGDVVLRLTDLQNDKRSIRQGLVKEKGIITSAYDAVYPASGHDSRYWAYALLAMDLAKYYYSMGGGVRQSIKFKDFPNDWLHAPSQDRQKEIANFLDRETARIDQLIDRKKDFKNLLHTRLLSTIHESICGYNFPGKVLSQNNPWISKLNNEFRIYRLKQLVDFINGYAFDSSELSEQGVPVLRIGDVKPDFDLDGAQKYSGSLNQQDLRKFIVRKNDILIAMTGGTIGKTSIYKTSDLAYINQRVGIIRAKKVNIDYLRAFLISGICTEQINLLSFGGAQPNISSTDICNIFIPVPSDNLQEKIGSNLSKTLDAFSSMNCLIEKSIDGLVALRTSLITEAVTGQLDIHAWQSRGAGDRQLDQIERNTEQEHKSKKARA